MSGRPARGVLHQPPQQRVPVPVQPLGSLPAVRRRGRRHLRVPDPDGDRPQGVDGRPDDGDPRSGDRLVARRPRRDESIRQPRPDLCRPRRPGRTQGLRGREEVIRPAPDGLTGVAEPGVDAVEHLHRPFEPLERRRPLRPDPGPAERPVGRHHRGPGRLQSRGLRRRRGGHQVRPARAGQPQRLHPAQQVTDPRRPGPRQVRLVHGRLRENRPGVPGRQPGPQLRGFGRGWEWERLPSQRRGAVAECGRDRAGGVTGIATGHPLGLLRRPRSPFVPRARSVDRRLGGAQPARDPRVLAAERRPLRDGLVHACGRLLAGGPSALVQLDPRRHRARVRVPGRDLRPVHRRTTGPAEGRVTIEHPVDGLGHGCDALLRRRIGVDPHPVGVGADGGVAHCPAQQHAPVGPGLLQPPERPRPREQGPRLGPAPLQHGAVDAPGRRIGRLARPLEDPAGGPVRLRPVDPGPEPGVHRGCRQPPQQVVDQAGRGVDRGELAVQRTRRVRYHSSVGIVAAQPVDVHPAAVEPRRPVGDAGHQVGVVAAQGLGHGHPGSERRVPDDVERAEPPAGHAAPDRVDGPVPPAAGQCRVPLAPDQIVGARDEGVEGAPRVVHRGGHVRAPGRVVGAARQAGHGAPDAGPARFRDQGSDQVTVAVEDQPQPPAAGVRNPEGRHQDLAGPTLDVQHTDRHPVDVTGDPGRRDVHRRGPRYGRPRPAQPPVHQGCHGTGHRPADLHRTPARHLADRPTVSGLRHLMQHRQHRAVPVDHEPVTATRRPGTEGRDPDLGRPVGPVDQHGHHVGLPARPAGCLLGRSIPRDRQPRPRRPVPDRRPLRCRPAAGGRAVGSGPIRRQALRCRRDLRDRRIPHRVPQLRIGAVAAQQPPPARSRRRCDACRVRGRDVEHDPVPRVPMGQRERPHRHLLAVVHRHPEQLRVGRDHAVDQRPGRRGERADAGPCARTSRIPRFPPHQVAERQCLRVVQPQPAARGGPGRRRLDRPAAQRRPERVDRPALRFVGQHHGDVPGGIENEEQRFGSGVVPPEHVERSPPWTGVRRPGPEAHQDVVRSGRRPRVPGPPGQGLVDRQHLGHREGRRRVQLRRPPGLVRGGRLGRRHPDRHRLDQVRLGGHVCRGVEHRRLGRRQVTGQPTQRVQVAQREGQHLDVALQLAHPFGESGEVGAGPAGTVDPRRPADVQPRHRGPGTGRVLGEHVGQPLGEPLVLADDPSPPPIQCGTGRHRLRYRGAAAPPGHRQRVVRLQRLQATLDPIKAPPDLRPRRRLPEAVRGNPPRTGGRAGLDAPPEQGDPQIVGVRSSPLPSRSRAGAQPVQLGLVSLPQPQRRRPGHQL